VTTLGDRFTVEREIGRGGMATVVLAHDRVLDRRVAVKLLSADLSAALGAERFGQEIRVTARLVHPNIVPLFDSGEVDGQLFYTMPYVDGETLRTVLDRGVRLPVEQAIRLASDIAEALAYAHAQGVVHRDIKPENIFVYGGRALIADFGIAKAVSGTANLTQTGAIVGTVAYMSPEQASADELTDGRADIYSLGCVLFEMLSGRAPFAGHTTMAILAQHFTGAVPELDAPTSANLGTLVKQMMAKAPADRPASAAAVLETLRPKTPTDPNATPLLPPEKKTPRSPSLLAYDEGRQYWLRGMQGGAQGADKMETAIVMFERALELDPSNVLAVCGMADALHTLAYRGFRPLVETVAESQRLRRLALSMNDQVAELRSSIGVMHLYWDDEIDLAREEFQIALDLDPDSPLIVRFWAVLLKILGRPEEALPFAKRAIELDARLAAAHNTLGDILMATGRYDEAIGPLRTAIRLNPKFEPALERLEIASHRSGRADEAMTARRALIGQRGLTERLQLLDDDIARFGWAAAREIDNRRDLERLLAKAATEDPSVDRGTSRQLSDDIICAYAELGEWRSAMDWVERMYHKRPGRLRRVLTDFPYDRRGLAADPRYAPLLRLAGLEELL
jgi:tetratricopeptide (TPR) repeat protein/tRNA A-37 threonylcarbamoyl transferase component Bud32